MEESGRIEPHVGANPYAYTGTGSAVAAGQSAPAHKVRYPIEFTGSTREYFRIWIVNLALTILTLGIYSAWAKIRKKRYFYGNTLIDGECFDYRAQPVAILKGRLIAVTALALYYACSELAPTYRWLLLLAAPFLLPWLIVRSMAFSAYNTTYRNIRLHFRGGYREALKILWGYGLLIIVTLGFAYPYLKARLVRYSAAYHDYGNTAFAVDDVRRLFRNVYLGVLLRGFLAGIVIAGCHLALGQSAAAGIATSVVTYVLYLWIFSYSRVGYINAAFNHLMLGPVDFECKLATGELFRLYLVNIVAIILTLGLAAPWAVIRTLRYRASKMTLLATGGLDNFIASESGEVSATGEEAGEVFGVDFSL